MTAANSKGHAAAESIVEFMLATADAQAIRWPATKEGLRTLMEGVELWANQVRSFRVDEFGFTGGKGEGYGTRSMWPRPLVSVFQSVMCSSRFFSSLPRLPLALALPLPFPLPLPLRL